MDSAADPPSVVSQDVAADNPSAVFQEAASHHQLGRREDAVLCASAALPFTSTPPSCPS
jgi:hypothetical protein